MFIESHCVRNIFNICQLIYKKQLYIFLLRQLFLKMAFFQIFRDTFNDWVGQGQLDSYIFIYLLSQDIVYMKKMKKIGPLIDVPRQEDRSLAPIPGNCILLSLSSCPKQACLFFNGSLSCGPYYMFFVPAVLKFIDLFAH